MPFQENVLAALNAFVSSHAARNGQLELLLTALAGLRRQAEDAEANPQAGIPLPCLHLSPLVYAAVTGNQTAALPLGAVSALVYLGADILDDLADGDSRSHWTGHGPAEITLAAATCLACLPQLILSELDASPAVRDALQRSLAEGLLRMSGGQLRDLATAGATDDVSARSVEAAVTAKSGEEFALFCRLGAQFAGAAEATTDLYTQMGRELGTGLQLASDCYELFEDPQGRDFAAGQRTLPIALHLGRLAGTERTDFLQLLNSARQQEPARQRVRQLLRAGGELRRCAFIIEVYRQRALRLLREADPRDPAAGSLRELIGGISFFSTRPGSDPGKE